MSIDRSKWVYVHGYAEANDHWNVLEREGYGFSPAIEIVGRTALRQAGVTIEDIDFLDLYSCFPVAVQVTRDMLGIAEDDNRLLTVTGGLPYFGGPGTTMSCTPWRKWLRFCVSIPARQDLSREILFT